MFGFRPLNLQKLKPFESCGVTEVMVLQDGVLVVKTMVSRGRDVEFYQTVLDDLFRSSRSKLDLRPCELFVRFGGVGLEF